MEPPYEALVVTSRRLLHDGQKADDFSCYMQLNLIISLVKLSSTVPGT